MLRLVLREGVALAGGGVVAGVPLAALVSIAFSKAFVEIGGFDPMVIVGAAVLLAASAVTASLVPARRATRIVPVAALRAE